LDLLFHAVQTGEVEQSQLGRHVPQPFTGIIIGNQDFGIFAAVVIPLGKVIDAADRFNLIVYVELSDKGAVVVADQPFLQDNAFFFFYLVVWLTAICCNKKSVP